MLTLLTATATLEPAPSDAALLDLDATSLRPDDLSLPALMRELNLQQRPSWLLRKLMNALERKRQAKGLGWSRAWNKYGVTVFRTHTQNIETDADYFRTLRPLLDHVLANAPAFYRKFATDLMADPSRMAFTFYHNHDSGDGRQFEGVTVSLGRRVAADPTKRDRVDLILEDVRHNGGVDGVVDRVRVYVCPWSTYGVDRTFHLHEQTEFSAFERELVDAAYATCVSKYHAWKNDPRRQWSHWSARYIDYFGPRQFIPTGSSFT